MQLANASPWPVEGPAGAFLDAPHATPDAAISNPAPRAAMVETVVRGWLRVITVCIDTTHRITPA
jgi:hypothetical protein